MVSQMNPEATDHSSEIAAPLFVEENASYCLKLWLREEKLACLAEIEVYPSAPSAGNATVLTPPDLLWYLQQNQIVEAVDYDAVYEFCAALDMGCAPPPMMLARGVEPQAGADGWFELNVKISGKQVEFSEDEQGNVDLRTLNAYSEIEPGQKLGVVHSPGEGIPGRTVQGLTIPAQPGKPFALIAGEGVELKYDGRMAFAVKAGRVLLEKNTLSVVDELIIPGDLDLRVGNIDFHGFVEIRGDVPDDFSVKARRGIRIKGGVGACQITSEGSIEMASMAGKGIGRIDCHGDLRAGFLNQITAAVYGDIVASHEIRNCHVKATGKILVERGVILGGRCTAMEGIEAKVLGSVAGQKTEVIAGVFFPDIDRFVYLREQLQNIKCQIESIREALWPLQRMINSDEELAEAASLRSRILHEQLDRLCEEQNCYNAELKASSPQQFTRQNPKINVLKELHEGVVLTLGENCEKIRIDRSGPISIIENSWDGGLRYLTLSPLKIMARQLEEEILAAEVTGVGGG